MIHSLKVDKYRQGFEELLHDLDLDLEQSEAPITVSNWIDLEGIKYENEIFERLLILSEGTSFEKTFQIISGQKFPDIVSMINKNFGFGVEAKTTKKNNWTSTGSSIIESTRIDGLDKIFLSFAKLGGSPEFITRPYEACLSGVAVTHSPRYTIDMRLAESDTIHYKIGTSYDSIRKSDRPFDLFKKHYTEGRDPDKILWWADVSDDNVPPVLRLWSEVDTEERETIRLEAYLRFPEVLKSSGRTKYNRTSLWLASSKAVVASSLRDLFSAGGKRTIQNYGVNEVLPAVVFKFIKDLSQSDDIIDQALPKDFAPEQWIKEIASALNSYNPPISKCLRNSFLEQLKIKFS